MSAVSLHARLPRIAPDAARLRTTLLEALGGVIVDGAPVAARAESATHEGGWIVFDCEPGRILLRFAGADPLAAMQALGEREPLVAAIERALGLELMPVGLVAQPAPDAVVVALVHSDARAWLAVAPGVALAPPPARLPASPWSDALRVPVGGRVAGPALGAHDLTELAAGDLLLCPGGGAATLVAGGRTIHARLTSAPLRAHVEAVAATLPETSMTAEPSAPPQPGDRDIPVPLTIALDGVTMTLGQLAGLREGSVVELGRAGASLPVRLLVGEQAVATGELIAVGEGYGVLIKARA